MDEIVRRALLKRPDVPACTGWLLLDRRGQWRMRDEQAQATGAAGSIVTHAALRAFIERNYACDKKGQWYFQNGPQRVYVDLEYTPFVVRLQEEIQAEEVTLRLYDHIGQTFTAEACWSDDAGNILFSQSGRVALLHDHDLEIISRHLNLDVVQKDEDARSSIQRQDDNTHASSVSLRNEFGIGALRLGTRTLEIAPIERARVPDYFGFIQRPRIEKPTPLTNQP